MYHFSYPDCFITEHEKLAWDYFGCLLTRGCDAGCLPTRLSSKTYRRSAAHSNATHQINKYFRTTRQKEAVLIRPEAAAVDWISQHSPCVEVSQTGYNTQDKLPMSSSTPTLSHHTMLRTRCKEPPCLCSGIRWPYLKQTNNGTHEFDSASDRQQCCRGRQGGRGGGP